MASGQRTTACARARASTRIGVAVPAGVATRARTTLPVVADATVCAVYVRSSANWPGVAAMAESAGLAARAAALLKVEAHVAAAAAAAAPAVHLRAGVRVFVAVGVLVAEAAGIPAVAHALLPVETYASHPATSHALGGTAWAVVREAAGVAAGAGPLLPVETHAVGGARRSLSSPTIAVMRKPA